MKRLKPYSKEPGLQLEGNEVSLKDSKLGNDKVGLLPKKFTPAAVWTMTRRMKRLETGRPVGRLWRDPLVFPRYLIVFLVHKECKL